MTFNAQVGMEEKQTNLSSSTLLEHIDGAIRHQRSIWKILDEALAESNIVKILNEALAEFNISKMTRHTRLDSNTNNIVRAFRRVQYCWYCCQAECGVLFWPYRAMMECCTVNMDFISSLGKFRKCGHSNFLCSNFLGNYFFSRINRN